MMRERKKRKKNGKWGIVTVLLYYMNCRGERKMSEDGVPKQWRSGTASCLLVCAEQSSPSAFH